MRILTADELKRMLGLVPHEAEGGWFCETYRASQTVPAGSPGSGRAGDRSLSTAIYYLLTPETFSAMHRLRSDEVFHFYLGDPVEMLQLLPSGEGRVHVMGTDLAAGMRPQVLVPRDVWQGTRLTTHGRLALLGTTVSPGFDPADYETGERARLLAAYPDFRERITALTR